MIKGVIFDLDDTLYLEADYAKSGMTFIGYWVADMWGIEGFGDELHRLWAENIRTKTFDIALEIIGAKLTQPQIMKMVEAYRCHMPHINLPTDSIDVLNELKEKFSLGLITDGFAIAQKQKIKALQVADWIDHIVITDSLGRNFWKPSPIPYEAIENKMSLAGYECLYIGDNITKDFITAKKRGWKTIQLQREGRIHQDPENIDLSFAADIKIDNLRLLPNIIIDG